MHWRKKYFINNKSEEKRDGIEPGEFLFWLIWKFSQWTLLISLRHWKTRVVMTMKTNPLYWLSNVEGDTSILIFFVCVCLKRNSVSFDSNFSNFYCCQGRFPMSFEVKVNSRIILFILSLLHNRSDCFWFTWTLYLVKKKFSARSDRVKSVDLHPTEPWVLASLFNGNVFIYNYQTQVHKHFLLKIMKMFLQCLSLSPFWFGFSFSLILSLLQ
jgi:hypothetical protein